MSVYVDIPNPATIGQEDNAWQNVYVAKNKAEAVAWIRDNIGPCDVDGRISLLSNVDPADLSLQTFDIVLYDTREGEDGVVRGVPASSEEEACRKVAEKKGWRFVKTKSGVGFFAINPDYFLGWYFGGRETPPTAEEAEAAVSSHVEQVENEATDEFRGLYALHSYQGGVEVWAD